LMVSHTWHRISTPLVYHTVVLRSKGQASTLAKILHARRKLELGTYIRNLMVVGGFGKDMKRILQSTPNLRILRLTL
ncbi:hypothetical protein B0H12DRAFT_991109, partial [Mycena haematopus]